MDGPAWCREMLPEPTGSSHAPPGDEGTAPGCWVSPCPSHSPAGVHPILLQPPPSSTPKPLPTLQGEAFLRRPHALQGLLEDQKPPAPTLLCGYFVQITRSIPDQFISIQDQLWSL